MKLDRRFVYTGIFILLAGATLIWLFRGTLISRAYETYLITKSNILDKEERSPSAIDFVVFGHLYGSPEVDDGIPARSITRRLPQLLKWQPNFYVSLGDMVYRNNRQEFENLQTIFLSRLNAPFYNTPGNHDTGKSDLHYNEFVGTQTYHTQVYGPAYLIFLDTEIQECSLDNVQIQILADGLQEAVNDPQTRYIVVFMHKTLVFQDVEMRKLKSRLAMPNEWKCQQRSGQNPLIDQYFRPAAKKKPVIIFAGDVGAWGNLTPYYQRDRYLPLITVMTGLGDTSSDNVIRVHMDESTIDMTAIFLDTMEEKNVEDYNRSHWLQTAGE